MEKKQQLVRLDSDLVEQLRTYERLTGVSLTRILHEAVSTWLDTSAMPRLKVLLEQVQKRGPKARPNRSEQELLARYLPQNDLEEGEEPYSTVHLHNSDPVPPEWRFKIVSAEPGGRV